MSLQILRYDQAQISNMAGGIKHKEHFRQHPIQKITHMNFEEYG